MWHLELLCLLFLIDCTGSWSRVPANIGLPAMKINWVELISSVMKGAKSLICKEENYFIEGNQKERILKEMGLYILNNFAIQRLIIE